MIVYPLKPPFSYEPLQAGSDVFYRIRDSQDNAIGRTYVKANAQIIVDALNLASVGGTKA